MSATHTPESETGAPGAPDDPQPDGEDGFDTGAPERQAADHDPDALIIDVEGFEGPLDVLLAMAKTQKVDLAKISILALVEQYLSFIAEAKRLRLELAADYLVMAAWLTYLKSRLLLPEPESDEEAPSGEELAARLQFQLQRLEAMREAAARLMARDRLGRDVFPRGAPEPIRVVALAQYKDTLTDLLKAYARQRTRNIEVSYQPERPPIFTIEEARHRIESLLGKLTDWSTLEAFLPTGEDGPPMDRRKRRSFLASTFTATLELVRDGYLEVRQLQDFGPVYVRPCSAEDRARADAQRLREDRAADKADGEYTDPDDADPDAPAGELVTFPAEARATGTDGRPVPTGRSGSDDTSSSSDE